MNANHLSTFFPLVLELPNGDGFVAASPMGLYGFHFIDSFKFIGLHSITAFEDSEVLTVYSVNTTTVPSIDQRARFEIHWRCRYEFGKRSRLMAL